jgi:hypothetical protein
MIHCEHLGRVVHRAVAVIVVADRAVEHMVLEQTVEGFSLRGVSSGGLVCTCIPEETFVAQARPSWPLTSTIQVSHV